MPGNTQPGSREAVIHPKSMSCRVWRRLYAGGLKLLQASCVCALTGTNPLSPAKLQLPKASIISYPSSHWVPHGVRPRHHYHLCTGGDRQAQRGTERDQCCTAGKVLSATASPRPPAAPGVPLSCWSCLPSTPPHSVRPLSEPVSSAPPLSQHPHFAPTPRPPSTF